MCGQSFSAELQICLTFLDECDQPGPYLPSQCLLECAWHSSLISNNNIKRFLWHSVDYPTGFSRWVVLWFHLGLEVPASRIDFFLRSPSPTWILRCLSEMQIWAGLSPKHLILRCPSLCIAYYSWPASSMTLRPTWIHSHFLMPPTCTASSMLRSLLTFSLP